MKECPKNFPPDGINDGRPNEVRYQLKEAWTLDAFEKVLLDKLGIPPDVSEPDCRADLVD